MPKVQKTQSPRYKSTKTPMPKVQKPQVEKVLDQGTETQRPSFFKNSIFCLNFVILHFLKMKPYI